MQRDETLNLLRSGPKTTSELRECGIFNPASRIKELRGIGHKIETTLSPDHRGAKYNLLEECEK